MHTSANLFFERILSDERVAGKHIIEIGSYNVNGSVRDRIESMRPKQYVGVDMQAQAGYVDVVSNVLDIHEVFSADSFDVVLCAEMLEHAEHWKESINAMVRLLRPGGLIVLSARGPGFPLHGYPSDYWRFRIEDIAATFVGFTTIWLSDDTDPNSPGIFYAGIKNPANLTANPDHI